MGVLMLRCSMTDRNFSTGINSDKRKFRLMPDTTRVVRCPQCGQEHSWRPQDAWLVDSNRGRPLIVSDNPKNPNVGTRLDRAS